MSVRPKRVASDPKVAVLQHILEAANRHDAGTIAKYFAEDGGRRPTGRVINLPVAFIIKFGGGKIKHWKSYYDSGTMFKQMGA